VTGPARVLTVKNPWAALIAKGVKDVENRTWHTEYRGPLAIHAGLSYDETAHQDPVAGAAFTDDDRVRRLKRQELPSGAIVALVDLWDVHSYRECQGRNRGASCSLWGQPQAIHWCLRDVREILDPFPWAGGLGLRKLSPEVTETLLERVK
jgi:hypothetical protein